MSDIYSIKIKNKNGIILKTANKICTKNITLTLDESLFVSVAEITFTIDGTSYTAEEGMTWETYKGSKYDVLGLYDYMGNVASSTLTPSNSAYVFYISGAKWNDTILDGGVYTTKYLSGGAG